MKKPVRRPTAEEIAAFEETGRAIARDRKFAKKAARKSVKAESRTPVNTQTHEHGNTEIRDRVNAESSFSAKADSREHGNPFSQKHDNTDAQVVVDTEVRHSVNTETRISVPIVRLTIDLPEAVHTRFKTACAMTKRKMVDEVRDFIERRVAELEGEAGRRL
ncbi:hypothetical protein Nham_0571 [Nitrobacter hamburgensis X14]|uniref:Uncharacterized protein n=1 Tax=Nitrobacter hamburgensis (strain DSM 10229 / NCIMB 13809 / X14) TaxID=323097 RepID=Q1QQN6_NITHX|nr:hypothetical protein [Nitrobacter hamburgensis]ABE61461.1 hypothetical protein Nham_0571 [Nitrobacter hamburgensis X14]